MMKRLAKTWARQRRSTRTLAFRVDRPRRIDWVIDYFGERLTLRPVLDRAPQKS